MAKVSPAQNVFEGEFSPLAAGRTDLERYGRAMKYMMNTVACRTGPAIGRSGTYFEQRCMEPGYPSKMLPFEYNEEECVTMEFGHYKMRFYYDYNGVAAHREKVVSQTTVVAPFTFEAPGHDVVVGESLVFSGFPAQYNVNGVIAKVTSVVGSTITTDWNASPGPPGMIGTEVMAVVYEVATVYDRNDVKYLKIVQELNTCYLFCGNESGTEYRPQILTRHDTFDWRFTPMPDSDGPYLDINLTKTHLIPLAKGTWVPDMTSSTVPSGLAEASTEVAGHEAWKAFDGDLDSYWESNASQEGWLSYSFESDFIDILPSFTGPTSGAMTLSASSNSTNDEPWRASDGTNETDWRSATDGLVPQWWQVDLGAAQTVRVYALRASKTREEFSPKDWKLEGSASGAGPWSDLDVRTDHDWDSGQRRQFTVQSPAAFRYYRVRVTKVNRKSKTETTPAEGKKDKKGYIPETTTTTKSDERVALSNVQFSLGSGVPRIVTGYTIHLGRKAQGHRTEDHAPLTWYFEGWDGDKWQLLDTQQNYTKWTEYRSKHFDIQNDEAYIKYRVRIKEAKKEGDVNPRIGKLSLSSPDSPTVPIQATSKEGINDDQGFLITDVGRIVRLQDADNIWRWGTITAVSNETTITLNMSGHDPLVLNDQIKFWRLGLWSDTTGWPDCGVIHEDRLFLAGAHGFPDHVVASRTGNHTNFKHVDEDGVVVDDHGIVLRCNSRYMSHIMWLKASEEALRIGTGRNEFVISTPVDEALTSRNAKIRQTTRRGSSYHEPVTVDTDVIFIQTSGRALYANTYSLGNSGEAAAYSSELMSKLGQHLLEPRLVQIVYQQEPHSVIWGRRLDGSVVAMTYSNDDDIFGGHRHNFGCTVHDLMVINSPTDRQDALWMVTLRTISGVPTFYIERMYRFWDYGDILTEDATFVDCAVRYYGNVATDKVYGLRHLEGQYLDVLADKIVYKGLGPVTNGMLQLERPALYIVVGLRFTTEGEIIAPDVGAEDGTAQGKSKRPHRVVLSLWETANGEVGRLEEDHGVVEYVPVEYNYPQDELVPEVTLRTVKTKVTVLPGGYGVEGTVRFRQSDPLPFNLVALYPQMYVEDEG